MSEITIADTAKYHHNKGMQVLGVLMGSILPVFMLVESYNPNDSNMPQILDNEQATTICLQESFDNASLTDKGFHIDLSRAEIDACATSKIGQSEQTQSAYIKDREDNAWRPLTLAGIFSAISLAVAGAGFVSNRRLRKEKPGIEKVRHPIKPDPTLYF